MSRSRGDWFLIDVEEYIKLVSCRTRVIWLGKFLDPHILKRIFQVNGIQARGCRLHSAAEWINFIDSCYSLLAFSNGCQQPQRIGVTLSLMKQSSVDPIFCTVFDTQRNKRLIVDGLHRANALTLACNEGKEDFIVVSIVELEIELT